MKVFSVATMAEITRIHEKDLSAYESTSIRTAAVLLTLDHAKRIVESNSCDIAERGYTYAIIEEYELPHFYQTPLNEWWYKWEGSWDDGKYVACEKPEKWKNVVSWGMS